MNAEQGRMFRYDLLHKVCHMVAVMKDVSPMKVARERQSALLWTKSHCGENSEVWCTPFYEMDDIAVMRSLNEGLIHIMVEFVDHGETRATCVVKLPVGKFGSRHIAHEHFAEQAWDLHLIRCAQAVIAIATCALRGAVTTRIDVPNKVLEFGLCDDLDADWLVPDNEEILQSLHHIAMDELEEGPIHGLRRIAQKMDDVADLLRIKAEVARSVSDFVMLASTNVRLHL